MELSLIFQLFCCVIWSLCSVSASFTPLDNVLISCGSTKNTTVDGRVFVGDETNPKFLTFSASKSSVPVTDPNPSPNSSALYDTARVCQGSCSYGFNLGTKGLIFVRLHFSPFDSNEGFNLSSAVFGVSANGFSLFGNFSARNLILREFVMKVDGGGFEIRVLGQGGLGFGFVSAIEVFSAPDGLIVDDEVNLLNATSEEVQDLGNITSHTMETLYRINVGGSKVTPFNDTLWRTWVPDDEYLFLKAAAEKVAISSTPNYQDGFATRETAPDAVYMTAQEMNKINQSAAADFNITWRFPIRVVGRCMVRLHFCDIVSASSELYFDVYINKLLAIKDLNLPHLTNNLDVPYYNDFVTDTANLGQVEVSVGPSSLNSDALTKNAFLNGVEILKIVDGVVAEAGAGSKRKKPLVIVALVLGVIAALCIATVVVFLALKCRKRKLKLKPAAESGGGIRLQAHASSPFSRRTEQTTTSALPRGETGLRIPFAEIQAATNNFHQGLVIGSGGFGMVYKGVLKDNTKVAVKRGVPGSRQGPQEFHTEISILSKIRHRHLVALVGYCGEQSEMILVYEYMENGPLKKHLYGGGLPPLSWKQRLDICIGAARGLHYLHTGFTQGIIHRDIKSTNILLDENYIAKVADFGLSREGPSLDETHVSTSVKGSFGYLDPDYFRRKQLTDKSDVYSFGVLMFEILCARPVLDPDLSREQVNLAEWALEWQRQGKLEEIMDPHLLGQIKPSSLRKYAEVAEKCLKKYGVDRPTMGEVLWNLEYTLQLQESEAGTEVEEHSSILLPSSQVAARLPQVSSFKITRGDDSGESLDPATSQVFSQLITNEGR